MCCAGPPADASASKATPPASLREFEHALRGLGFTRLQAAHIARKGFAGATAEAAPTVDDTETLRHALDRLARTMKV